MREIIIFKSFIDSLKTSELKQGTINFYENHTRHLELFLIDNYSIKKNSDFIQDMALDYIVWNKSNVSASTVNKRIVIVLKRLIQFYKMEKRFTQVMKFKKMKELGLSFETIELSDMKKILEYTSSISNTKYNGLMRKTAIFLLAYTGVRINELLNIQVKNIDLERNELLLTTTKNGKARITYIHPDTMDILKIAIEDAKSKNRKVLLWNSTFNTPLTSKAIVYFINEIKKELGLSKLHPHMFRHFYATTLIDNGVNIKIVQELMDHTNLATTQRYAHAGKEKQKKAYLEKFKL